METLFNESGFLLGMPWWGGYLIFILAPLLLAFWGSPLWVWTLFVGFLLFGFQVSLGAWVAFIILACIFNIPLLRRLLVTHFILKIMKGVIPKISETERVALEAGVVWAEAELFSGRPNMKKLMSEPYPTLTEEEKAFMEGPVEELCYKLNDWKIWKTRELPDEIFQFIKEKKFLGMIIPKEYGGLGFSALAHSEVIQKVSSRSITASITIMVPNSLGPAELLIHYGTQEQKEKYLPRLADGREIPCFGLTEPQAGSDAGAIQAEGVLFKGEDGEIYIRLNWNKRWITLAAISTLIGLAFKLKDPDNLLGRGENLGITCALIPSDTKGVVLGRRHDPMTIPFYNCPTQGHDVVVKAEDAIIGGLKMAGHGWKMLMESLAAGRGISLPAQNTGGIKLCARAVSAHSLIRKQFGVSIAKFEGVEEPLARIASSAYFVEALRRYTISPLDQGIKPPIVTAMAKYNATEQGRKTVADTMDVFGGAGISLGPKNLVGIPYMSMPIGITVEGANILTRTLMIFGQGALRAHPFAFKEIDAVLKGDVVAFDQAFWGHIGHLVHNFGRTVLLSLTRGRLGSRGYGGPMAKYFRKLSWASASFALFADIAMGLLGGRLKFKEKITGRFADIFSWLYIATAVLRRFEFEGQRKEDLALVRYSLKLAFMNIQKAFDGILANFDVPFVGWIFKGPIRWWSRLNSLTDGPSDRLGHLVVKALLDKEVRDRLSEGIFVPKNTEDQLCLLDKTFELIKQTEHLEKKIRKAIKKGELPKTDKASEQIDLAVSKNILTQEEAEQLRKLEELRWEAIQVDDFSEEEYKNAVC
ncbi:MAG: acyl-CoA dehydrogenase [Bdellovibrio sp.]|nr:MAG: acyl-CoA dehydrogenase [Bdellovibrio sp.]